MKLSKHYRESLPLQMLAEGYCKSIENAKRLIDDGMFLLKIIDM